MPADPLIDRPSWVPRWLSIDDARTVRWVRRAAVAVFAVGVGACVVEGANEPADPELGAPVSDASALASRFGTILVEIVTDSGELLEFCLLHADDGDERSRGLMQVTDLEGHDGMLFDNDAPVEHPFVMINTVMPLSITWWQDGGGYLSGTEMTPCTEADPADCPRFPPGGPYRYAIEVPQGALDDAGIGAASELRIGPQGCTPA